jgi:glucan-binding YG repeat protein
MAQIPNYNLIASRGQTIANGIQRGFDIMAQTTSSAIQEYKNKRTVENAYTNGVRKNIFDNAQRYGLSNSQADAMAQRMKYKEGESIEDYEKRIAPTLNNMVIWESYVKDPEYKVDLPNPFTDTQTFISSMDAAKQKREDKEIGEAVQRTVLGDEQALGGEPGPSRPDVKTQEEATQRIAGRVGVDRPVSNEQLQQFPAFRSLPTQAGIAKQKQTETKEALQTRKTEADIGLTEQKTATQRALELKASKTKKQDVDNLKDLVAITRAELAAGVILKNTIKEDAEGNPTEEWIDAKEVVDLLRKKRIEVEKRGAVEDPNAIKPGMEAIQIADKIQEDIQKAGAKDEAAQMSIVVDRLSMLALTRGIQMDKAKIEAAMKQGHSAADIAQRIIMRAPQQPQQGNIPQLQQAHEPSVPGVGGRIGR